MTDLSQAVWKKASYSNGANACVEVAGNLRDAVAVRDSKRPSDGALVLSHATFAQFVGEVKSGNFDL